MNLICISLSLFLDSPTLLGEDGVRENHIDVMEGKAISLDEVLEFFDI